jgi:tetratricopeptide (TPR) repeat protein
MVRRVLNSAAILALFVAPALSFEKAPEPKLTPTAPTPEEAALLNQGIALHDARDYAGAVAKYKQILAGNPDEVGAMYEMSFSYFAMKDYENALAIARHGAEYRSGNLARFYVIIGNSLDDSGRREEAIEFYRDAVERAPEFALLHYNMSLALRRAGNNAEAKPALQKALRLNPVHPTSHLLLGTIYKDLGYRLPAVMALSRFLEIEHASARAAETRAVLQQLISGNVTKGDQPNRINIQISPESKKDEGDFASAEMAVAISVAAATTEKRKNQSAYQTLVTTYRAMAQTMGNARPGQGFAATYYAPYFIDLEKAGHVEAFVSQIWAEGQVAGLSDWAKDHGAKIQDFLAWSQAYRWAGNR